MLTLTEKIGFILLAIFSLSYAAIGFYRVYRAIARGRPDPRLDHLARRVSQALWVVLTQQSVFKKRPVISLLHALVFYGFVYYGLVNIVDGLEGFFPWRARGGAWDFFNLIADLLTAGVLVGILGLVIRRFIVQPQDFYFNPNVPLREGVTRGILRDSSIVAGFIVLHVGSRLLSKAAELALQGPDAYQPVGSTVAGIFTAMEPSGVELLRHAFWWGALGSILVFIPYFPRSKHIHIFMAPINLALRKEQAGVLEPMDFEKEESFGAAKLEDFSWPRLLDAYSCIMCNRCQQACPAYATGKALSPAAIVINERYELNRILPAFGAGGNSPRPLLEFAISEEAAWACTTCNACVEVCPVGNEPMLHILDVRRERVLMQAEFPAGLKKAFTSMEGVGNPLGISPDERLAWSERLPFAVPTTDQNPNPEVLYWVGCAASYDPRAQKIARSLAEILSAAGLSWAVLGRREKCTGDAARRAGNEYLFAQMATENVETLNALNPKLIVTACPHCFHTLKNEYPQFGGHYLVKHHGDFINELLESGKLRLAKGSEGAVTFHDPCYLGRHNGVYDPPRGVLRKTASSVTEPKNNRSNSFCCGAGGAQYWKEEERGSERVGTRRYRELQDTGARVLATACPFCMRMLSDEAAKEEPDRALEVLDIAEIAAKGLQK